MRQARTTARTADFGLAMSALGENQNRAHTHLQPWKKFQAIAIEHAFLLSMQEHYDKAGVSRCIGSDPDTKICPNIAS